MAATNIANLDGLDAVLLVLAAGETALKAIVKDLITRFADGEPRLVELFIGQMAAEGFTPATGVGLLYTLASPTVRIEVYQQAAGQKLVKASVYVGSAWVQVAQFPANVL